MNSSLADPKQDNQEEHGARLKRAVVAIRRLQAKLDRIEHGRTEPIAVVGMGCRFPGGVTDAVTFWELLRQGEEGIVEVPANRWPADAFYDPDPDRPGRMC